MATPFKMKGSPMQRNFGVGSPLREDKSKKRTMSVSDEQTLIDNQNLEKAANRDKQGGIGDKTIVEQTATEKSRKRQAVIEAQEMERKELKKNAKGGKLKKFFTSTKKLKSEVTANAYRNAKGKKGQSLQKGDVKDKDKYSGVKES
tara:strand:- start:1164 stop:1601 length:438 start_codon:yes stop_codon:yes gene_type:complete